MFRRAGFSGSASMWDALDAVDVPKYGRNDFLLGPREVKNQRARQTVCRELVSKESDQKRKVEIKKISLLVFVDWDPVLCEYGTQNLQGLCEFSHTTIRKAVARGW